MAHVLKARYTKYVLSVSPKQDFVPHAIATHLQTFQALQATK